MKLYLAGPMTGYPQFNFPLFYKAAAELRAEGYDIVSPAEMDEVDGTAKEAMASSDGDVTKITKTWGDLLARDVKIVSDEVDGIVFLPNWPDSKGARLEAFVALLAKKQEFMYYSTRARLSRDDVWEAIKVGMA